MIQEASGRLILLSMPECLQRLRPEVMIFRTLVGLDYDTTEAALVSSLERLADWVLNLVDPAAPGQGSLLHTALRRGISVLQGASVGGEAPRNLMLGLEALLGAVAEALQCLRVTAASASGIPAWGIYSSSLAGWGRAHQCRQVAWTVQDPSPQRAVNRSLLAGRVLSGATLAFLEQHAGAGVGRLWVEEAPVAAEARAPLVRWVAQAIRRLVQRGLWQCHVPPGRVWIQGACGYLLWPLAGQDLMKEIAVLTGELPAGSPEQWLQALVRAECVVLAGREPLITVQHPLLMRPVTAVRLVQPLEATLLECLQ
ncbi:MAG: hypothetical protein ACYDCF_05275 [Burkholderiales bacterium]